MDVDPTRSGERLRNINFPWDIEITQLSCSSFFFLSFSANLKQFNVGRSQPRIIKVDFNYSRRACRNRVPKSFVISLKTTRKQSSRRHFFSSQFAFLMKSNCLRWCVAADVDLEANNNLDAWKLRTQIMLLRCDLWSRTFCHSIHERRSWVGRRFKWRADTQVFRRKTELFAKCERNKICIRAKWSN